MVFLVEVFFESFVAQQAGGAMSAAVARYAVVAGDGVVSDDVEHAETVGEGPRLAFVEPHKRGVDDECVVHSEVKGSIEAVDESVAAVRVAAVVGL